MKKFLILFSLNLYLLSCNNQHDEILEYFSDGQISTRYNVNSKGHIDGQSIHYFPNGNIRETKFFENGILNGDYKKYYGNGNLEYKCTMENGMVRGLVYFYSSEGKIEEISNYLNDSTILVSKSFYANGNPKYFFSNKSFSLDPNTEVRFDTEGNLDFENSTFVEMSFLTKNVLSISFRGSFKNYPDSLILYVKNDKISDKVKVRGKLKKGSYKRRVSIPFDERNNFHLKLSDNDYYNGRLNIEVFPYRAAQKSMDPHIFYPPDTRSYFIQLNKGEEPKKYNLDYIE